MEWQILYKITSVVADFVEQLVHMAEVLNNLLLEAPYYFFYFFFYRLVFLIYYHKGRFLKLENCHGQLIERLYAIYCFLEILSCPDRLIKCRDLLVCTTNLLLYAIPDKVPLLAVSDDSYHLGQSVTFSSNF